MKAPWRVAVLVLAGAAMGAQAPYVRPPTLAESPSGIDETPTRPPIFVLTDIGNEPDDQMSLVRLLLYSDELDIRGLVATTSTWQKDLTQPATILQVIDAYGRVQPNLKKHGLLWPTAAELKARVSTGPRGFGLQAIDRLKLSSGAAALIRETDIPKLWPLHVSVWGGANTLAEALMQVRATRSPAELDAFVARLRVYSISDQDDAGPWIRREFPKLVYTVKPSPPNSEEYASATWTGISGDVYYNNCAGADASVVTNEWLDQNIRRKGPLGARYPRFEFIMEGDTPSFLNLLENGLESFYNPSWGGWGGRHVYRTPFGETRPIWTQGGDVFTRVTSADTVVGVDGKTYTSDQATIWRWRRAFQNDFAARMDWTVQDFAHANHRPLAFINGQYGTEPVFLEAEVGKPLRLDASESRDPDETPLASFRWYHYAEAGAAPGVELGSVQIEGADSARATVTPTAACRGNWLNATRACAMGVAHLILEVSDRGTPALTGYRRVVLKIRDPKVKQQELRSHALRRGRPMVALGRRIRSAG